MSKDKKQIFKPKPISGFTEWLPEVRLLEQKWMDHIRRVFESYGYCNIETPSVEELDVLRAKGEVDKEIYVLERLHKEDTDESEARLALHFDQTVPLARYTAQHFNDLVFPFKRYQMQRVWRGERPQIGRSREFYQCDIDVINADQLLLHFDAEMPAVIYEALMGLDIGKIQIRISNRKILLGLLEALKVEDPIAVTRHVDKLDKIGEEAVRHNLEQDGLTETQIDKVMIVITSKTLDIEAENEQMREGLDELKFVMDRLSHLPEGAAVADLSIVRGLDYYTGTVYETQLLDIPEFTSSVCSGGRYDDLASAYINKHLPGVGISIGFTRLFDVLYRNGRLDHLISAKTPADVLVIVPNEEQQPLAQETAQTLRQRGLRVELYHAPQKLKKQLSYAEKKGIPHIWFPPFDADSEHEVKDMASGNQAKADPQSWTPPKEAS